MATTASWSLMKAPAIWPAWSNGMRALAGIVRAVYSPSCRPLAASIIRRVTSK